MKPTEYLAVGRYGPVAKASAGGLKNKPKAPKKSKDKGMADITKAAAQLPGVSPGRLHRIAILEKGVARLQKNGVGRNGAFDAGMGTLVASLLTEKLAASEELAAARNGQAMAQQKVTASGAQTMTSGQRQGMSNYQRILAATTALGEARKSGDPLAIDRASQDLTLAKLSLAHKRGII